MKYIAIYHANLNYSGLDEDRYEFVIRESYEKIFDLYENELKGVPYCFEASGYTLDKMQEYCPDVVEKLKTAVDKGQCEVLASPYPHLMLPNFPYRDGVKSLEFTLDSYQKILGMTPESGWNPECGWRHDIPQMFKSTGFKNLVIDWDAQLISNDPKIKEYESGKGPYGHTLPFSQVDPDSPELHHPVKIMDGLTGIFRTDRVSNKFLFYLMAAMKDNPKYKDLYGDLHDEHAIELDEIIENIKHWSGKKGDGFLLTYADDAEYIGTSGYFLVKYYNKDEFFLANPSHERLYNLIKGIYQLDKGFMTVSEAVKTVPTIEDFNFHIDDDMAWHRTRASKWAQTPTSLEWDPFCKDLSKRLTFLEDHSKGQFKEEIKAAWFALTCAENSDGRWPPPPQKPGAFNIDYCIKFLNEAKTRIEHLESVFAK
ncbi:MAG: hypothetical protein ACERKD_20145 [Prolixibacteraceae bacterium]